MANVVDETKAMSETRFMNGRRMIKSSVKEVTDENVVEVLFRAMETHNLNRSEIDYLWKYYRGEQPIRHRVKDVRPEICTDTGRVIQKINPKRLTAMRRKMKKLAPKMTEKDFTDWYTSWFRNHYKIMSRLQRSNMDTLFNKLKEVTLCSTQSHSLTEEV